MRLAPDANCTRGDATLQWVRARKLCATAKKYGWYFTDQTGNGLQFLGDLANNVPVERGVAAEQIREGMQPLLALPVEIVLLTHGAPTDRGALERALATPRG